MASFHLHNRDSLLEAVRLFVRATELDSNYASPYGMASWSGALRNSHGWMVDRESEITDAVRLARRAVAVGKDDPTALWSGGLSLAYLAKEVEAGAAYIDRALVLNPNSSASWNASGWVHMYLGEYASAIEHFERAMRLSPLDPLTYFASTGMAYAYALADRYDWRHPGRLRPSTSNRTGPRHCGWRRLPMLFRIGWSKRGRRWPACARSIPR